MARDDDQDFDELDEEELGDFTPVMHARSMAEAQRYLQLLEDYGIPARIDEDFQPKAVAEAVTVLVPESLLEDAKGFIADLEEIKDLAEDEDLLEDDEEEEELEEEETKAGTVLGDAEDEEDEEDLEAEDDEEELVLEEEEEDEDEEEEDKEE